jgi:predicted nucleic acid-binding protein
VTATTCDTSVLVPALVAWHPDHDTARSAVADTVTAVPAHVILECYSVLTRLPAPHRISPTDAAAVVSALDLVPVHLPAERHRDLVVSCARNGIRGGAVYDAVVAATATHHGLVLLTRDRRACSAYDAVGARYTFL